MLIKKKNTLENLIVNIVYLIGNGFDLNLGLKTSYKDFYHYYINNKEEEEEEEEEEGEIKLFKRTISKNINKWSDLEAELGKYTDNLTSPTQLDNIHENLVNKLADYLGCIQDHFEKNDLTSVNKDKFISNIFNPEMYLLNRDQLALKEYINKIASKELKFDLINFNYTNIIEHILNLDINSPINKNLNIHKTEDNINYTLNSTFHLHGTIDKDMVLGVNSESQILNSEMSSENNVKDLIIKSKCNAIMRHGLDLECEKMISQAHVICIFGSSIGKTDQIWWDLIAKQIKTRGCKLIIFEYHLNLQQRRSNLNERLRKETLLKFFEETEIEEIYQHVYLSFNSQMFNLKSTD